MSNKSLEKSTKIAFFSNRDSYVDNNICYYDGGNGRLIASIMDIFPNTTLVTYADPELRRRYNMLLSPQKVYSLPFLNTFRNGLVHTWSVIQLLKKLEKENDLLIIQLPFKSFLAPLFLKKPVVYHICSNLRTASVNPLKYKGWRLLIAKTYAELFHCFHFLYMRRKEVRLISNGSELAALYGRSSDQSVISTSIFKREIIPENELPNRNKVFRILFIGRPSLEKGFDTLLDAVRLLEKESLDFEVWCGGFDRKGFEETWKQQLPTSLNNKVKFLGEIAFSETLFDIYRQCDVFVLPSRSEGTPRVLVEARAFGCPVVATIVGGIPDSVRHNHDGLLFSAGDADTLCRHIYRLANDEPFRRKLQRNGRKIVSEKMTLEIFANAFKISVIELLKEIKE